MGISLLKILPENFFGVLAGPVKEIYGHILLRIYDMSKIYGFGIPRENLVEEIQQYLELLETGNLPSEGAEPPLPEGQNQEEFSSTPPPRLSQLTQLLEKDLRESLDEVYRAGLTSAGSTAVRPVVVLESLPLSQVGSDGEAPVVLRSARERANDIIRKLKRTGWIDIEVRSDYREVVVIPDYSMEILRALHRIASQEKPSYRGYVYGTYAALVEAAEPRADAVNVAYDATNELIGYLHSLYQNIKRYTKKMLAQKRPQDILAVRFLEYQQEILDKAYHQLKTSDSVYKYRSKILSTVRAWKNDPTIISMLAQSALDEKLSTGSLAEARSDILSKLSFIETSYANIDHILNEIDRKNEQYARASLQQVKYFLNNSRDTEGALIQLLCLMGDFLERGLMGKRTVSPVDRLFSLVDVEVLDSASLYTPRKARTHTPAEICDDEPDDAEVEAAHRWLAKSLFQRISYEEVDNWVVKKLGHRDSGRASEMNLESMDDFVRLIYAAAYSQNKRVSYEIEPLDTIAESAGGMFRFTDMIIARKHGISRQKHPQKHSGSNRKERPNAELVPRVREHELKTAGGLFEDS